MIFAAPFFLLQVAAVPPPVEQASADCRYTTYATDHLVCSDGELSSLDAQMKGLIEQNGVPDGAWVEPQHVWFRRSRLCAMRDDHHACVEIAYRERIALLSTPRHMAASDTAIRCRRASFRIVPGGDGAALFDASGSLQGFARAATESWTPFLTLVPKGRGNLVRTLDGKKLAKCD